MTQKLYITSAVVAILLAGCATAQENPNYQYSTKYNGSSPYTQSASSPSQGVTPTQASYSTQSAPIVYNSQPVYQANYPQAGQPVYTQVNHECLARETNRELIGGAIGGTAGAFAGKELIGGTKGVVAGAVLGGAVGYGIGDKSINCDPVPVSQPSQPYYSQQSAQPTVYATPQTGSIVIPSTDDYYGETVGTPGYEALSNVAPTPVAAPQPSYTTSQERYVPSQAPIATRSQEFYPSAVPGSNGTLLHTVVQNDTVYSLSRRLCSSVSEIQTLNNLAPSFDIQIGQTLRLPASRC